MDVEQKGNLSPRGRNRQEAETRLREYGPNAVRKATPYFSSQSPVPGTELRPDNPAEPLAI